MADGPLPRDWGAAEGYVTVGHCQEPLIGLQYGQWEPYQKTTMRDLHSWQFHS